MLPPEACSHPIRLFFAVRDSLAPAWLSGNAARRSRVGDDEAVTVAARLFPDPHRIGRRRAYMLG
jgi:hypothetical protein